MKFVYQDDHTSPEYIFHNQYPINCLLNLSKVFKNAISQINKLLGCYGIVFFARFYASHETFRLPAIPSFCLNCKKLGRAMWYRQE